MKPTGKAPDTDSIARTRAELHRDIELKHKSYRDRALAMFPHVCGSCGREFSGKRLRELTVHHRDHDHTNNPADGSNWELLCLYCHDNEHEKHKLAGSRGSSPHQPSGGGFNALSGLDSILKPKE
ncbi:MAG: HNH nuclease family protein [Lentisphaerae bacterium]|nr:HNH nuclease family protein [Lentisphaerota bacterium]